jgi:hypothetical protein
MILFEIKLTAPQIDMLRVFKDMSDAYAEAGLQPWERPKEGTRADDAHSEVYNGISSRHFSASTPVLKREGLIGHSTKPHPHWFITEKGRLVLRVVELDVEDFQKAISTTTATKRFRKRA